MHDVREVMVHACLRDIDGSELILAFVTGARP